MVFKTIGIISTIFLLLSTFNNKITKEFRSRLNYYNGLLKQNSNNILLNYDASGLYLENKEEMSSSNLDGTFFTIHQSNIISGCVFFPFKDYFTDLMVKYYNANTHIYHHENIIPIYTLVYQMLYLRFGNKEYIRKFYKKNIADYESEFYNFNLKPEIKDFMEKIEPIENQPRSVFYYTNEEIKLSQKFGFILRQYNLAMEIFQFVKESTEKISDKDESKKTLLLPIVSNLEYFKIYTDYVIRNSMPLKISDFKNTFINEQTRTEYDKHQDELQENFKIPYQVCLCLIPIVDLLRFKTVNEVFPTADPKLQAENGYLTFKLAPQSNDKIPSKTILGYSKNRIESMGHADQVYINYGIWPSESDQITYSVNYTFDKRTFSPQKAQACSMLGCGNFPVKFFMENRDVEKLTHLFLFNKENHFHLNQHLLNVLKLNLIHDTRLLEDKTVKKLAAGEKFDNSLESKALLSYHDLIIQNIPNQEIKELITEVDQIQINNKEDRKIKLFSIYLEKVSILQSQLGIIYKEYETLLREDFRNIKKNFFDN
jgi:hypothetical protein